MITNFKIFEKNDDDNISIVDNGYGVIIIIGDKKFIIYYADGHDKIEIDTWQILDKKKNTRKLFDYEISYNNIFDFNEKNKEFLKIIYFEVLKNEKKRWINILKEYLEQVPDIDLLNKTKDFNL